MDGHTGVTLSYNMLGQNQHSAALKHSTSVVS